MSAVSLTQAAAVTYGAALTFETLAGEDGPLRVRPAGDTLLRVIGGAVRLTVDGVERLLGAGDEAVVPAGVPHRLASVGGEARFVTGVRPARRR